MELTLDEALQKGIEAHKSGQIEEADRLYTAILNAQPNHPDANHNMGVLAVSAGKVKEALPFFQAALEAKPSTAQFWLSYLGALIQLDQIVDAKAVFDQAKENGANGEAFEQLEQQLAENKVKIYETNSIGIEGVNSSKPNILDDIKLDKALRLAKRKSTEGQLEEAKDIYQDILQKFPKNKQALTALTLLTGSATPVAKDPPLGQLQPIINLYAQGELKQALSHATKMLEKFPGSIVLYNIAGASNLGLTQFDAAIKSYKHVLKIKPGYAEAYYNMGMVLNAKGDSEAAIESYKEALKIKPGYAEAYYNLGNILNAKGDLQAAIDSYKKALKMKPDFAEAYNNMGNVLKYKGDFQAALNSYKQALKIKPDYAEAYFSMA